MSNVNAKCNDHLAIIVQKLIIAELSAVQRMLIYVRTYRRRQTIELTHSAIRCVNTEHRDHLIIRINFQWVYGITINIHIVTSVKTLLQVYRGRAIILPECAGCVSVYTECFNIKQT